MTYNYTKNDSSYNLLNIYSHVYIIFIFIHFSYIYIHNFHYSM